MDPNYREVTLPNTSTVWGMEKAGPDDDGSYEGAYSMRVGIYEVAKRMVGAQKELNGYSAEVEWDAHALTTIETLSSKIQDWATTPPNAQDLLMLYGSTLIQGTPDQIKMTFGTVLPEAYVTQGYTTTNYSVVKVDMEDIKRVPPEYPNWNPSESGAGIYARPDGTYFSLCYAPSNPPPALKPDPNWDMKYTWQEWDIDFKQTNITWASNFKTLLPTWIDSLSAVKKDLTTQSQTQVGYLQDITEQYDRMFGLLQGLIDSMKKVLETLLSKQ
ncbi:hypothetical protein H6CHR_01854 [Variovorax sp. PBL-H6]|uniref:hypothetical protein n=1 Tax=Variovorax sp. PBL-H6 TaxID=434009 RepID=UPI001318125C|nr:hypothetical protein [Variovorax sp. PBL-H6]VTU22772.1 hypothetical protein H6CHR_01854 [Variovorax sp. PBL-H6]